MEIGGYDTIFDNISDPVGLATEIMASIDWKDSVVERDVGQDFFYYENQAAKDAWDKDGAVPVLENTMVYFIVCNNQLSVVTDKELTDKIRDKFPNYTKFNAGLA